MTIEGIEVLYVNLITAIECGFEHIANKFANLYHKDTGVICISFEDDEEKMFELLGMNCSSIELNLDDAVNGTRLSEKSWDGLVYTYTNLNDMSINDRIVVLKLLNERYNKLTVS